MLALTLDIDWATDKTIDISLKLLSKYNVKCTLFATHKSDLLLNLNENLFEIGLHPNYNDLLDGKEIGRKEDVIGKLLSMYPAAKGVRSHCLTQSSTLLSLYKSLNLRYECNQFYPNNSSIYPYKCWTGLTRIPFNWEDDVEILYNHNVRKFNAGNLSGNWIFNFHPFHLAINTGNWEWYLKAKGFYHDDEKILNHVNTKSYGVRDFFIDLLSHIKDNNSQTFKMSEIAEMVR